MKSELPKALEFVEQFGKFTRMRLQIIHYLNYVKVKK